ncbi:hypothetical protein GQ54DRAFT_128284 [Martensiomyces pterosporus]|nr:hypothetical protein GQ54DRAFT_128284 [Martensiomyces pterosporus]
MFGEKHAVAHGQEESTAACCCQCLAHRPLSPLPLFFCVRLPLSRLCCSPPCKQAFLSRLLLSFPRSFLLALSFLSPCFLVHAALGSFGARLVIQSSRLSSFAHSTGGFVGSSRGACGRQQHPLAQAAALSVAAGTVLVVAAHTHSLGASARHKRAAAHYPTLPLVCHAHSVVRVKAAKQTDMAFLDELPLEILLAVVNWLTQEHMYKPEFCKLLPVASISTSLRQSLLPLLYRDLVFEFRRIRNCSTCHNAALANSAGCSEYVQRVSLFTNRDTDPDDIVRAVRDDIDAGNEAKWPNLRSYAYNNVHKFIGVDLFSCSDIIRQLDKELPKLRQVSPNACDMSSDITPVAYTPPSVSFLAQLTSLWLSCNNQCIDINRLPQVFASTLVDLTLDGVNPENIWNAFYDGHEGQTVVFARLKCLFIQFENPLDWGQIAWCRCTWTMDMCTLISMPSCSKT